MPSYQISIRQFLAFACFSALSIAALSRGGTLGTIVLGLSITISTAFAIVAFVGRGRARSFAIGFIVAYSAALFSLGDSEFNPYEQVFSTRTALEPAYELIVKRDYLDRITGETIANFDPATDLGGGGFGVGRVKIRTTPDKDTFMTLARVIIAMALGYIGANFAVLIERMQAIEKTHEGA